MPRETDRQEYVMNDVGIIYNGEFNNITSRSWNFGQVGSFLEMFVHKENKRSSAYGGLFKLTHSLNILCGFL